MKSRANNPRSKTQRQRLANEIARLMWEGQIEDFKLAKEKAIRRFGLRQAELPDNRAISEALNAYSELFSPGGHDEQRARYLALASDLMQQMIAFNPRVVGLEAGVAVTPGSTLRIHAFSDHVEAFDLFLQERGIEYQLEDKRFRFAVDEYETRPSYLLEYQGVKVCISVFPQVARSRVPLSPVDGRPVTRMSQRMVEEMINSL